jgi:hypothetical protein
VSRTGPLLFAGALAGHGRLERYDRIGPHLAGAVHQDVADLAGSRVQDPASDGDDRPGLASVASDDARAEREQWSCADLQRPSAITAQAGRVARCPRRTRPCTAIGLIPCLVSDVCTRVIFLFAAPPAEPDRAAFCGQARIERWAGRSAATPQPWWCGEPAEPPRP